MTERESPFWAAVRGEIDPPPAAKLLGWKVLKAEKDSGEITVEFSATEQFTNPMGAIQGGILAAMLDDTLGPALATTFGPDEFAPTLELKVNFIASARPGRLVGTGRVTKRGRSVAFLNGELHDSNGKLIATASATAQLIKVQEDEFMI